MFPLAAPGAEKRARQPMRHSGLVRRRAMAYLQRLAAESSAAGQLDSLGRFFETISYTCHMRELSQNSPKLSSGAFARIAFKGSLSKNEQISPSVLLIFY